MVRIKRAIAESEKFSDEQKKLIAEQRKLNAESEKFAAEARKFNRERVLAPWQVVFLLVGGAGGFIGGITGAVALWHTLSTVAH